MVAAVVDLATQPIAMWREVRCRTKTCRTLLLRYRVAADARRPDARIVVELVCPDRRCRRSQTVELPIGGNVVR